MGRRILRITNRYLPYFFGAGERHYRVIEDALPEDARVTHATLDYTGRPSNNDVVFVLESSQWSDVPEGDPIPEVMPRMQSILLPLHEADAD